MAQDDLHLLHWNTSPVRQGISEDRVGTSANILRRTRGLCRAIREQTHAQLRPHLVTRPRAGRHTPPQELISAAPGADLGIALAPAEAFRSDLVGLAQMLARPRPL